MRCNVMYYVISFMNTSFSPMDFLVTPRYRWVYIALFFVMAASLINAYSSLNQFDIKELYLDIFYKIRKCH